MQINNNYYNIGTCEVKKGLKMKRVNCFEAYTDLIKNTKDTFPSVIYNAILMPKEIQRLIEEKKLFYREMPQGLAVYRIEKDFYKLYLFLEESRIVHIEKLDKPIVVELIYSERRLDSNVLKMESKCGAMGFEPYVTNLRRTIQLETMNYSNFFEVEENCQYKIKPAVLSQSDKLIALWNESLDQYDSILPTMSELEIQIQRGEIYCLLKNGELVGAFKLKKENNKWGSIWLVAVESSQRGNGLAGVLLGEVLQKALDWGLKYCYIWTDMRNHSMERVLEKMNFRLDGIRSEEYILAKK